MFGKDCKYKHKDLESKRYLQYRTKACVKQQQFGGCPFGDHCRYRHEEPSRSRLRIFQQLANGIGC
jgi:hypothetical protein